MAADPDTTAAVPPDRRDPEAPVRTGPGTLAGTPWTRWDLLVGGLVAVASVALTFVFRQEVIPTDPWHYVMAAIDFPQKTWVPLGYTRYGMILPVIPLAKVFGTSQVTFLFWPYVGAGLLAGTLYLIGRRWWGPVGGAVAVVATLSNWVVFVNLPRYYPDLISTAYVLAAVVLALEVRGRQGAGRGRVLPLLLLGGFLLGWSFESRETAIFGWAVVAVILWVPGRRLRNALWTALPVLAWGAVDVTISAVAYGDPLLKLHTFTRQNLATSSIAGDVAVLPEFVGRPRLDYLLMIPKEMLGHGPASSTAAVPGGVWFLGLAVVALLGVVLKDAAARLSAFGLAVTYVFFVGIGGFFLPSHPAGRLDIVRYWIPFVPWMGLGVAGVVVGLSRLLGRLLARRSVRPAVATGLAVVLGVAAVAGPVVALAREIPRTSALAPNGGMALSEVRTYLAAHDTPGATVWSDFYTVRLLPIYKRGPFGGAREWTMPTRSITGKDVVLRPGDYVVWTDAHNPSCGFCGVVMAQYAAAHPGPPASWTPVLTTTDGGLTLYRVGSTS